MLENLIKLSKKVKLHFFTESADKKSRKTVDTPLNRSRANSKDRISKRL